MAGVQVCSAAETMHGLHTSGTTVDYSTGNKHV